MTITPISSEGWLLQTAIQRTQPDYLLEKIKSLEAAIEQQRGQYSYLKRERPEFAASGRDALSAVVGDLARLKETINSNIGQLMQDDRLVSRGAKGGSDGLVQFIERDDWLTLTNFNVEASAAGEDRGGGVCFFKLRCWPLIESPVAAERLAGLDLAQAFQRAVINDVEVQKMARAADESETSLKRAVNRRGDDSRHWPARFEDVDFVSILQGTASFQWSSEKALPDITEFATLFKRKYGLFMELLRTGALIADGISRPGGMRDPVDSAFWSREDYWIDFEAGDLILWPLDAARETHFKSIKLSLPVMGSLHLDGSTDSLEPFMEAGEDGRKAGRPQTHDWLKVYDRLFAKVYTGGSPGTGVALVAMALECFRELKTSEPHEGTAKNRLKKDLPLFWKLATTRE